MTPNPNELFVYIDRLIAATKSGHVDWAKANPTTYIWTSSGTVPARLMIQRVDRSPADRMKAQALNPTLRLPVRYYVFQAVELPNAVKLSINGSEDQEPNAKLEELYETITSGFARKGLDFLKSILPPE